MKIDITEFSAQTLKDVNDVLLVAIKQINDKMPEYLFLPHPKSERLNNFRIAVLISLQHVENEEKITSN